jgi:hypothetical protein
MAGGEIVAGFFLWVLEVSDYGQVNHGRLLTNHEGLAREMPFQDPEEIIKPVFKKLEHIWIGRRCQNALIAVCRHVARQLMIIPEQPTQDFKLILLISTSEPTIPLRKPKQDWRRLSETLLILFKDGYLAHLIHGRAPLRRPGDTTSEICPDGLECLTAEGQHQGNFVAVT